MRAVYIVFFLAATDQQPGDARIAQFPQRAIEDEMVDVYDRSENQEAGGEVVMQYAADDPRPGNEERDAAGDEVRKYPVIRQPEWPAARASRRW